VPSIEVRLASGETVVVEGTVEEVEKKLSDAARSGQSRLAWFRERGTDEPVGINPMHVGTLRTRTSSD
jgi:hypothetical protein